MARVARTVQNEALYAAALKGLELEKQRIEEQIAEVRALLGKRGGRAKAQAAGTAGAKPAKKRELSPAARKRIAMAQKRRWAEYRKKGGADKKES